MSLWHGPRDRDSEIAPALGCTQFTREREIPVTQKIHSTLGALRQTETYVRAAGSKSKQSDVDEEVIHQREQSLTDN